MIKNFIMETTEKNIPSKTSNGKQSLPWINNHIKSLIRRRNRTHANYKKTNSSRIKRKWQEANMNII